MVSGLSQMPPIIISRPASMRLAMAISPSRDKQLDLPHLAQVHAHRIVRAAGIVVDIAARLGLFLVFRLLRLVEIVRLDDIDAHFGERGHHILDLLGGILLRRQGGVQLIIGDVAALLALRQHALDRAGKADISQRRIRLIRRIRAFCLACRFCHYPDLICAILLPDWVF